jgi:hypothetical protein
MTLAYSPHSFSVVPPFSTALDATRLHSRGGRTPRRPSTRLVLDSPTRVHHCGRPWKDAVSECHRCCARRKHKSESSDHEHCPQQCISCPRISKTSASDLWCSPCGPDGLRNELTRYGCFCGSVLNVFAHAVPSDRWPCSWRSWGEVVSSEGGHSSAMVLMSRVSDDDVIKRHLQVSLMSRDPLASSSKRADRC